MLLTDLVIRTGHGTLEQAPDVFDGIGMNVPAHVLLAPVVDNGVLGIVVGNAKALKT